MPSPFGKGSRPRRFTGESAMMGEREFTQFGYNVTSIALDYRKARAILQKRHAPDAYKCHRNRKPTTAVAGLLSRA